jgi:hypothetical protein
MELEVTLTIQEEWGIVGGPTKVKFTAVCSN